jgi:hypothetical protein
MSQVSPALFNVFKSRHAAGPAAAEALPTRIRFVCVSDTHNQLQAHIDAGLIPDGDVFLHAGDFTNKGKPEEVAAFSSHSLRVGAAQELLRAGFDTAAIMRAGGWRSTNVLARYLEYAEHNVWEAV